MNVWYRYLGTCLIVVAMSCSGGSGADDPIDLVAADVFDQRSEDPLDTISDTTIDLQDDSPSDLLTPLDTPSDLNPDTPPELPTCTCPPPTVTVTVNGIPSTMNGSQPYTANDFEEHPFHLALPTWGFAWEVTVDCPCGCAGDGLEALFATEEDAPVDGLESHFVAGDGAGVWSWDVPEDLALPAHPAGLCARVTDACGNETEWGCLQVELVESTAALHPFQPPDPWLLVWRRDHRTIGLTDDGDSVSVWSDPGSNGIWDFVEDLWLLGLGTPDATPEWAAMDCGWAQGGNECVVRSVLEATRPEAYKFYFKEADGTCLKHCADVVFLIEGETDAPDPVDFQYQTLVGDEDERNFSKIGLGGGDISQSHVGLSESMDPRNDGNEDNAKEGYGCLTTSLFQTFVEAMESDPGLKDLATVAFGDVIPFLGGTPFGAHPEDHLVINPEVADVELSASGLQRRKAWTIMVDALGLGLAALTVHEIGHSVGLVAYGAPPLGLFGGEKQAAFVENPNGSKGAHLDTVGLNLMQAGPGSGNGFEISFDLLSTPIGFNELNSAYLKGQVLLLP